VEAARALPLERVLFAAAPDAADVAGAWALTGALARCSGARVTVLGVAREPSADWAEAALPASLLGEIVSEELRASLAGWIGVSETRDVEVRIETAAGVPHVEVIRAVLRDRYDLVIVPAGAAGERGALGSAAQHLIRECPAPIWAVRGGRPQLPARIAVAIDADPDPGRQALDRKLVAVAVRLARLCGSALEVIHAFAPAPPVEVLRHRAGLPEPVLQGVVERMRAKRERWLTELLASERFESGRCVLHVLDGEPLDRIPAHLARSESDLLILGTEGRTGIAGLLIGNTAEAILGRVECSVLAIKPDGFESPVKLA
jgi:nucleotide-binding universal stress UspA family protein